MKSRKRRRKLSKRLKKRRKWIAAETPIAGYAIIVARLSMNPSFSKRSRRHQSLRLPLNRLIHEPKLIGSAGSFAAHARSVLASNPNRVGWWLQNLGTNTLFVRLGASASTSVFHCVLVGGGTNDSGTGGIITQTSGTVYTGVITIAGTSPRYAVLEM